MKEFIGKVVEAQSWMSSYVLEPYDSYKRRKGYMNRMLKALTEAMGMASDGRLIPVLEYAAEVVSNQMGIGKTEREREAHFSVLSDVLGSYLDILQKLEEAEDVKENILDILELLHYDVDLVTLRKVQRFLSALYDALGSNDRTKLKSDLAEILFILSRDEEKGLDEALRVLTNRQ
ncbi:MAG: hypothetical protein GXO39_07395 [Thermotogae bacterium]|nr:hypothetical protein [Thermotogota bacterium]